MPVRLQCPSCAALIEVPESAAGQVWGCPSCLQHFQVPALPVPLPVPVPTEPEPAPPPQTEETPVEEPPAAVPSRRQRGAGRKYALLVWMIVIPSAISLTILTCLYVSMRNTTPEKREKPARPSPSQRKISFTTRPGLPSSSDCS
jgi:hypothetical protein